MKYSVSFAIAFIAISLVLFNCVQGFYVRYEPVEARSPAAIYVKTPNTFANGGRNLLRLERVRAGVPSYGRLAVINNPGHYPRAQSRSGEASPTVLLTRNVNQPCAPGHECGDYLTWWTGTAIQGDDEILENPQNIFQSVQSIQPVDVVVPPRPVELSHVSSEPLETDLSAEPELVHDAKPLVLHDTAHPVDVEDDLHPEEHSHDKPLESLPDLPVENKEAPLVLQDSVKPEVENDEASELESHHKLPVEGNAPLVQEDSVHPVVEEGLHEDVAHPGDSEVKPLTEESHDNLHEEAPVPLAAPAKGTLVLPENVQDRGLVQSKLRDGDKRKLDRPEKSNYKELTPEDNASLSGNETVHPLNDTVDIVKVETVKVERELEDNIDLDKKNETSFKPDQIELIIFTIVPVNSSFGEGLKPNPHLIPLFKSDEVVPPVNVTTTTITPVNSTEPPDTTTLKGRVWIN